MRRFILLMAFSLLHHYSFKVAKASEGCDYKKLTAHSCTKANFSLVEGVFRSSYRQLRSRYHQSQLADEKFESFKQELSNLLKLQDWLLQCEQSDFSLRQERSCVFLEDIQVFYKRGKAVYRYQTEYEGHRKCFATLERRNFHDGERQVFDSYPHTYLTLEDDMASSAFTVPNAEQDSLALKIYSALNTQVDSGRIEKEEWYQRSYSYWTKEESFPGNLFNLKCRSSYHDTEDAPYVCEFRFEEPSEEVQEGVEFERNENEWTVTLTEQKQARQFFEMMSKKSEHTTGSRRTWQSPRGEAELSCEVSYPEYRDVTQSIPVMEKTYSCTARMTIPPKEQKIR